MHPLLTFDGEATLRAGFERAVTRRSEVAATPDLVPAQLTTALAALALGDHEHAADPRTGLPAWLLPLIAARRLAWTGDVHALSTAWSAVREAAADLIERAPDNPIAAAITRAMAHDLERSATDVGDAAFAAVLHRFTRRARTTWQTGVDPAADAVLTALRVPNPDGRIPAATGERDVALGLWRAWAALELGMLSDDAAGLRHADAALAPAFIPAFVHGLLGIEPDAPRGRIRVAPRLTPGARSGSAAPIRFADGSLALDIDVEPRAITIRIGQEDGAIPFTALLEPVVAWPVVAQEIDGRHAALDVRQFGEGFVAPVQLVLDDVRTLRLFVDPPAGPG